MPLARMTRVLFALLLVACGGAETVVSATPQPPPEAPSEATTAPVGCVVSLDSRSGDIRFGGTLIEAFDPPTLGAALGEPERVERVETQENYEESGWEDMPPTSTMVPVTWVHSLYDTRSLAFETSESRMFLGRTIVRVFFENERHFDNREAPAAVPRTRGACALLIDGTLLDTTIDLVGDDVDHRTGHVVISGASFGLTSYTGIVDGLYLDSPGFRVTIHLDDGATQRAAYAEIIFRRPD